MKAIDLGLSIKWADCNIGAKTPEEYGGYFSWGETMEKNIYDESTYKWYINNKDLIKYNKFKKYGKIDNKIILEFNDDAAFFNLNKKWRIPTFNEWLELCHNCIYTWIENYNNTNINGLLSISKINNNSIFFTSNRLLYG